MKMPNGYGSFEEKFQPEEILVYLRKSRSDDPMLSVEEVLLKHETILREWMEHHLESPVPESNFYREVVSGETLDSRPEILKVLEKIESPQIKGILIVDIQRLSRGDLEDAGRLLKLLRYTNTKVITPQKIYDISNEYDRDFFERELKRGNEFLEYTKKILNNGRLLSVSQGNFIGSLPPYGYDKSWIMDGKRKCPTLTPNKDQAGVVYMIFDMFVNQNMGYIKIASHLDSLGIKAPNNVHWAPSTISGILSNVHYIGMVRWNWRKTIHIVENQEIIKIRPRQKREDYLIFKGKHSGIVPEELFESAQLKIGNYHCVKTKKTIQNPFAGILYCQCGKAMILRTYKKNGVARSSPRLLCTNQTHCNTGSVLYNEMFEYICNLLKGCIADFEIQMQNEDTNLISIHQSLITKLEKQLKELEMKELSQWESQSDPDPEKRMPQYIFKALNEKLLKEKSEVQKALQNAYQTLPTPIDYQAKILKYSDALAALQNPDVTAEDKNNYLKSIIDKLVYSKSRPINNNKNSEKTPFELKVNLKL